MGGAKMGFLTAGALLAWSDRLCKSFHFELATMLSTQFSEFIGASKRTSQVGL